MQLSKNGLDFIKQHEGYRKHKYLDSGGEPTIGYGHLITAQEEKQGHIEAQGSKFLINEGLNKLQAAIVLEKDTEIAQAAVTQGVSVPLNQHQFDALVSFVFNVGVSAFQKSTLKNLLNTGNYRAVETELMRWVHVNKKRNKGLVNRRKAEVQLWRKANVKPLSESRTMWGGIIATLTGLFTLLSTSPVFADVESLRPAIEQIANVFGEQYKSHVTTIIMLICTAYMMYARWDDSRKGRR